jgi:hypothetical protein
VPRAILILDVWNPYLTAAERDLVRGTVTESRSTTAIIAADREPLIVKSATSCLPQLCSPQTRQAPNLSRRAAGLRACATVKENSERLACYDRPSSACRLRLPRQSARGSQHCASSRRCASHRTGQWSAVAADERLQLTAPENRSRSHGHARGAEFVSHVDAERRALKVKRVL